MVNARHVSLMLTLGLGGLGFLPLASATATTPVVQPIVSAIANSHILAQREETPPPPPRTSRSGLCVVSPGLLEPNYVIWSDRPAFIWSIPDNADGLQMQQVRLLDDNPNPNRRRILWEAPLTGTTPGILYSGTPLQAGQRYTWELLFQRQYFGSSRPETVSLTFTFQVMDVESRTQLAAELDALTQPLRTAQTDGEAIAHRRADYFQEKQLWSDALQVLFSVENPSSTTVDRINTLVAQVCNPGR
jgi:hypothetical protein